MRTTCQLYMYATKRGISVASPLFRQAVEVLGLTRLQNVVGIEMPRKRQYVWSGWTNTRAVIR